jgi:hypothetical protein
MAGESRKGDGMSLTPTTSRNYAGRIFDQRTKYSRAQTPRNFNLDALIQDIHSRPEPVYAEGDTICLEDGTLRSITFRTYSASQKTWLYRMSTSQKNRFGGATSTGNITEQMVIGMDKSNALPAAADSHKVNGGWIVQFKSQRYELFQTWMNADGKVAVFERGTAIQFAQGMVMAYDSVKQWAIFRIRPYSGHKGEEWFLTLIQPDGKYAAAISAFAEVQLSKIGLAGFNEEGFPVEYHHYGLGFLFVRNVIENWCTEYIRNGITGYSNPNRPQFNIGDILKLPTGFMRPVQFITPYWIKAGQVGFRYWFYIRGKQLVDYAQDEVEIIHDVETVEVEFAAPQVNLVKVAQMELEGQPEPAADIQCVLEKMQKNMDFKDHTIHRLKDVLQDIEKACKNQSVDLNDDYSWLSYMANMGLNGGYYSDELKARFGLVPKPNHTIMAGLDEF